MLQNYHRSLLGAREEGANSNNVNCQRPTRPLLARIIRAALAMSDPMLPLPGLSPVCGKTIVAKFDGGVLSFNSPVMKFARPAVQLASA
jgi:hypothetical protein